MGKVVAQLRALVLGGDLHALLIGIQLIQGIRTGCHSLGPQRFRRKTGGHFSRYDAPQVSAQGQSLHLAVDEYRHLCFFIVSLGGGQLGPLRALALLFFRGFVHPQCTQGQPIGQQQGGASRNDKTLQTIAPSFGSY